MKDQPDNLTDNMRNPQGAQRLVCTLLDNSSIHKKIISERKEGEKGEQTHQRGNDTCDEKGRPHCNKL
jgi:hypothetical protein